MLKAFGRRPGVVGCALFLGAVVVAAPEVSWAKDRCTTKPAVCARLKAERAQRGASESKALVVRPVTPETRQLAPVALAADARCTTKPTVCARLRNEGALRTSVVPVTLASTPGERCTTKPVVCARLKNRPGQPAVTLAKDEAPTAVD